MKQISSLLTAVALLCGAGMANGQESKFFKTTKIKVKQGLAEAQLILGWMYSAGKGVPQDDAEAVKWYRKAAEQDYEAAQVELGWFLLDGELKDEVEAYAWLLLAKAHGNEKASKWIPDLEKRLTAEQIEKGQERAGLRRLIEERKENPKPSVESQ